MQQVMRQKVQLAKSILSLTTWGKELPLQFWHPLQRLTMLINVPTSRTIANLAEIWPVKFLMVNFKRVYLSCPSLDFNDLGIKILVRLCFI